MNLQKLSAIIFSALLAGLAACSSAREVKAGVPETVPDVQTVKLQAQTIPDTFPAVGTVHASRTAPLSSQLMGAVTAVNVHEGDSVKQGQVLAAIDDMQPRAGVEQARAALSAVEHELAAAESDLVLAQSTFNRLQTLYSKKSLSQQEYDEGHARLQSAEARRDTARAARTQAAAALDQARTHLGYTQVRSPFDGVVTERRVDPGALASPGMPLLTVEAGGYYRLEAAVDERDLQYVHLGQAVPVSLDSLGGQTLQGKVAQIVPAADPTSRSFTVKIDLPAEKNLRSGIFGRAAFARGTRQGVLLPQSAVTERGQLQTVYVVGENQIAMLRYVTLGAAQPDGREVLSGLNAGEIVVAAPGGRDFAGKRIEVR
ncbi:MAG TPA: efflux RND transporter periplasmic adaptor subunit [Terriglobales bacterium]|nr:efflux RND transporter periplasmic adaptor subunit [Terriglobales bacterium]